MKRAFLVPLALLLVVSLPLAEAHPVCASIARATDTRCEPGGDGVCEAVAEAITETGAAVAATCEDVL